nr:MAG TPA: hypothetical protein [Caudoviricetes sp.]
MEWSSPAHSILKNILYFLEIGLINMVLCSIFLFSPA